MFAIAGILLTAIAGCAGNPGVPTRTQAGAGATASSDAGRALDGPQASAAVAALRHAVVNGHSSSSQWLSAQSDGSFIATGFAAQSWSTDGPRVSLGLEVPEQVGGYTLYHLVPLTWDDSTSSRVDGRSRTVAEVFPEPSPTAESFDPSRYRITARFSVHDGWIHADSVTLESKDTTPGQLALGISSVYQYPYAVVPEARLAIDATLPAAPSPWLDVSDAPGSTPFTLTGWVNGLSTSGDTTVASVNVPDRLGPASIYHLAPVEYASSSQVPSALTNDGPPDDKPFHYPVRLRAGRLVAVLPAAR
jgi:hypothetical protein